MNRSFIGGVWISDYTLLNGRSCSWRKVSHQGYRNRTAAPCTLVGCFLHHMMIGGIDCSSSGNPAAIGIGDLSK